MERITTEVYTENEQHSPTIAIDSLRQSRITTMLWHKWSITMRRETEIECISLLDQKNLLQSTIGLGSSLVSW